MDSAPQMLTGLRAHRVTVQKYSKSKIHVVKIKVKVKLTQGNVFHTFDIQAIQHSVSTL
jgi:hypothetical protein